MPRKPVPNVCRRRFAQLLAEHLAAGIRPAAEKGEPWSDAAFSREVQSSRDAGQFASPRTVSNWRKGHSLPVEIQPILRALFGPISSNRHSEARANLRKAFDAARAEKAAAIVARSKLDPTGSTWVVQDEQLVMDRTVRATDRRAAADPIRKQLQSAICLMAEDLARRAARLANTRTWADLAKTAKSLQALASLDARQVLKRLGEAYALLLRLGAFLETDGRVRADRTLSDSPLDPDISGSLTLLVRTAAPWLRGFPTITRLDNAAGKVLTSANLIEPTRQFAQIARTEETISGRDAEEIESLTETANTQGFQSQKAGARAVGSTKNLLLTAAEVLAAFLVQATTSKSVSHSLLIQRVLMSLISAEPQIKAIVATLPDDLRHALHSLIDEGRRIAFSPTSTVPPSPPDADDRDRRQRIHKRDVPQRAPAVLFVCDSNAVRSLMAETLFRHLVGGHVHVRSAGVRKSEPDSFAVAAMAEIRLDIAKHKPITLEQLEDREDLNFDLIVTLAPEAHHRVLELTRWIAADVEYWPTPDPSVAGGTGAQRLDACRVIRDQLIRRIKARFRSIDDSRDRNRRG